MWVTERPFLPTLSIIHKTEDMSMDSEFIYQEILSKCPSSKRNIHYAKKYVSFIERCVSANTNTLNKKETERHHILPESMWPEYKKLNRNKWNLAVLTTRQHLLAHVMLAYSLEGDMWKALHCMIAMDPKDKKKRTEYSIYSKSYEKMKRNFASLISIRNSNRILINKNGVRKFVYSDEVDNYLDSGWYKGSGKASTRKGNVLWVKKNGEELQIETRELDLYLKDGWGYGRVITTKGTIAINKDSKMKRVSEDELSAYLDSGWTLGSGYASCEGRISITDGHSNKTVTEEVFLNEYSEFGWVKGKTTNNKKEKNKRVVINDGSSIKYVEKEKLEIWLGSGWEIGNIKLLCGYCGNRFIKPNIKLHEKKCVELQKRKLKPKKKGGRKKGSKFSEEAKQKMSDINKGKVWYNNGTSEKRMKQPIDSSWVRGRLKR